MPVDCIQLRISTPTEPPVPGRGFYQLEEDALYVPVGPFGVDRHFYSFLESPPVRLEFDRSGRLIFIEIRTPRRQWPTEPAFDAPERVETADVRWLEFRDEFEPPELTADSTRNRLVLRFGERIVDRCYYIADGVVAGVDQTECLAAIWISGITDDLAGREIAAFRKDQRAD